MVIGDSSGAEEVDWSLARLRAAEFTDAERVHARRQLRHLRECLGLQAAEAVASLIDLPSFDTAAMDGWAVAGAGPWRVIAEARAGERPPDLRAGEAIRIATGAAAPAGSGVVRSERGHERDGTLRADFAPEVGHDIRMRGEEVREGEVIVRAGTRLTPPALGLLAAAGLDRVWVLPAPRVALLVLGDELVDDGVPGPGRVRDALSPQLPGWLTAMGGDVVEISRVPDSLPDTIAAIRATDAEVVVTTGGTARGPADHVRAAVHALDGTSVVDGVRVRPGHPMKLARLGDGRPLVALPGNPLAAISGLVTLAWPLVAALGGRPGPSVRHRPLAQSIDPSPGSHRLVPARISGGSVHPALRRGPAMLSGIAEADVMVVIEPRDQPAPVGTPVATIPLPWVAAPSG